MKSGTYLGFTIFFLLLGYDQLSENNAQNFVRKLVSASVFDLTAWTKSFRDINSILHFNSLSILSDRIWRNYFEINYMHTSSNNFTLEPRQGDACQGIFSQGNPDQLNLRNADNNNACPNALFEKRSIEYFELHSLKQWIYSNFLNEYRKFSLWKLGYF